MGEIASGSWGFCKASSSDVTSVQPEELYNTVYPRLVFAPVLASLGLLYLRSSGTKKPCKEPQKSAVLITGGARGIGRDTADYLISQGYSVLVTVRKQSQYDEMKAAADESNNKTPYPILFDVTQEKHIPTALKQLKSFLDQHKKELISVVNNAGIHPESKNFFEDSEEKDFLTDPSIGTQIFETNVIGVGRVTKACLPMLAEGGTIVNLGSYFGSVAGALGLGHIYYESSKFALEGMTDNMRRSLKKKGIRVALIKPGNISTDMNAHGESSTKEVAMDIEHAISSATPKARYYPGKVKGYSTKFVCLLYEMLPTSMVDNM